MAIQPDAILAGNATFGARTEEELTEARDLLAEQVNQLKFEDSEVKRLEQELYRAKRSFTQQAVVVDRAKKFVMLSIMEMAGAEQS